MILGIGSDITDIRRIEKVIERHGERFLARIFTDIERAKRRAPREPRRDLCQALRRQGGLRQGARHRHPPRRVVARHGRGQPAVGPADHGADRRRAEAARRADAGGHEARIDLTITDEGPMALAFVVISAVPSQRRRESARGQIQDETRQDRGSRAERRVHRVASGASGGPENRLDIAFKRCAPHRVWRASSPHWNNILKSWTKFNLARPARSPRG